MKDLLIDTKKISNVSHQMRLSNERMDTSVDNLKKYFNNLSYLDSNEIFLDIANQLSSKALFFKNKRIDFAYRLDSFLNNDVALSYEDTEKKNI